MYKLVDSCGVLIARIVKGGETKGYLFLDYKDNNKYPITKESAVMMAGNDCLEIRIGNNEDALYLDHAKRIRSVSKLKLKDLPIIRETELLKAYSRKSIVNVNQLPEIFKGGYSR